MSTRSSLATMLRPDAVLGEPAPCRKFRRDFYGDFRHGQLLAAWINTRQCKLSVSVLELFFYFLLVRQVHLPNLHAVRRELEGFFIRLIIWCFDPTSGAGNHDQSSGDGLTIVTSAGSTALLLSDTRAWRG